MKNRITIVAFAFVVAMLTPTLRAEDFKAGYIDLQRALSEIEEAKSARARLNSYIQANKLSKADAAERERKEMEPFISKIEYIVAKVAERDGLHMVFDKQESGLLYAQRRMDITAEVIRLYNELAKSKSKQK